jgi:hypothetical protein
VPPCIELAPLRYAFSETSDNGGQTVIATVAELISRIDALAGESRQGERLHRESRIDGWHYPRAVAKLNVGAIGA